LRTALLERTAIPVEKPGETLHPGVEPIFRKLGVRDSVLAANFVRHHGFWRVTNGEHAFMPYAPAGQKWFGFQAVRSRLEEILIRAALSSGVDLLTPFRANDAVVEHGRIAGIIAGNNIIPCRIVIDCTGATQWLRRRLELKNTFASKRLIARYAYSSQPALGDGVYPVFRWDENGWTWSAPVGQAQHAYVSLDLAGFRNYAACYEVPGTRGADVTWRLLHECAGQGYFIAGDAAAVLDPASSHGVLKAMMSGMLAAELAAKVIRKMMPARVSSDYFRAWTANWFWSDVAALRKLYGDAGLDPELPTPHPGAGTRELQPTQ
jgi:flavin-dependent dehydrogenase